MSDDLLEQIKVVMKSGKSLGAFASVVPKAKIFRICANELRIEFTNYLKKQAEQITSRKDIITFTSLLRQTFKIKKLDRIDGLFKELVLSIVSEEFNRQKEIFTKESIEDFHEDVWRIYFLEGETLKYRTYDFNGINQPLLKLELKYFYRNELAVGKTRRLLDITTRLLNHLTTVNEDFKCFADITMADTAIIRSFLENECLTRGKKSISVQTIKSVFESLKDTIRYLMGCERSKELHTRIPESNPFERYAFKNLAGMRKETSAIPEYVLEQIMKNLDELTPSNRMILKIFMMTGLRSKEVSLLKKDCLESSDVDGCAYIKYTLYKVRSIRRRKSMPDESRILIPQTLADEIGIYLAQTDEIRGDSEYLFATVFMNRRTVTPDAVTFTCAVNQLIKKYNIFDEQGNLWKFSSRQFRKTVAVTLIENGASTSEVAYMLGHFYNTTAILYYEDVRKMKLAEMNTDFFKTKFEILIDREKLKEFTEEQRKCLYVDFSLHQRSVELGYCLKPFSEKVCTERNRLNGCVNCKNLCTGKKYLDYWNTLLKEQEELMDRLLKHYQQNNIEGFEGFKEYQQEKYLLDSYKDAVRKIEMGGV